MIASYKKLPKGLIMVAWFTKKCLFWMFAEKPVDVKVTPSKSQDEQTSLDKQQADTKCNFCNKCPDCANLDDKEEKKRKETEEFNSNVVALNYLAFLSLFLIILIFNMVIWISIVY
jgi:hypothetical protein